jgi:hypothetical protein
MTGAWTGREGTPNKTTKVEGAFERTEKTDTIPLQACCKEECGDMGLPKQSQGQRLVRILVARASLSKARLVRILVVC